MVAFLSLVSFQAFAGQPERPSPAPTRVWIEQPHRYTHARNLPRIENAKGSPFVTTRVCRAAAVGQWRLRRQVVWHLDLPFSRLRCPDWVIVLRSVEPARFGIGLIGLQVPARRAESGSDESQIPGSVVLLPTSNLIRAQRVDRSLVHGAARGHVRRDRGNNEQHQRGDGERPRIEWFDLQVTPDGTPSISFLDEDGKIVNQVGPTRSQ